MHRHLVAGHTELALAQLIELDAGAVDRQTRTGLSRAGLEAKPRLLIQRLLQSCAGAGRIDRLVDRPRLDTPLPIHASVTFGDAVASDARDPFPRDLSALREGQVAPLAQRRSDARMAAHAEVTDRPLREVVDALLEFVKDGGDGRVRMAAAAPLVVDRLVA